MRPLGVVVVRPALEDRTSLADREEQRLVEKLVAHATIEALDEPIQRRLAGRNVMPLDTRVARPDEDRVRGELGPVVADCPSSEHLAQLAA